MNRPLSASAIDATPAWQAPGRGDVERTVRSAGRHSRIVRLLRVVLPVGVLLGLGGYAAVTYFNPFGKLAALPAVSGKLAIQGSKITMEAPRIAGVTRDQRNYQLTAEKALQDIAKPDEIEMINMRAEIEMPDQDVVVITAKTGTYLPKGDSMVLREHVVVTSSQGYNAKLTQANVDMKKGNVVSDQPVDVKMPAGRVKANGMEVVESGALIRFTRGVVLDLDAAEPEAKK